MSRLCQTTITGSGSFICPAGVTQILITAGGDNTAISDTKVIFVVPNTTYTITVNSTVFALNNSNTFGTLYTWTASNILNIRWVE